MSTHSKSSSSRRIAGAVSESLECRVKKFRTPPRNIPKDVKFKSRFGYMPIDFIIKVIGFDNYREHTLKETDNLSRSIASKGLLEPILLSYDTKNSGWGFIDGEGRVWAGYQLGKDDIPVEVFYDVPEEIRLRMKIAANSTKTPIDSEDIAFFARRLYDMVKSFRAGITAELGLTKPDMKMTELARLIGRHEDTVRKYFTFTGLHNAVRDYVNTHRDQRLFSKSVQIGVKLGNKNHQREFFYYMLSKLGKGESWNDATFRERLNSFAQRKEEAPDDFFKMQEPSGPSRSVRIKELSIVVQDTVRYVNAFSHLLESYPDMQGQLREQLSAHLRSWQSSYDNMISQLPEHAAQIISKSLSAAPQKSFAERIMEQVESRRRKQLSRNRPTADKARRGYSRIPAIGDRIEYIPIENIRISKNQLRSHYNKNSIDALAVEMQSCGQLKPGLLQKSSSGGKSVYILRYGQSRLRAAKQAGLTHYKAFVRDDMTSLEVSILQCMEDLSEQDSAAERAKVLNKHYRLMRLKNEREGKEYSKEEFFKEFNHLGSRKTLRHALEFMELDDNLRAMVFSGFIGYEAAISIGGLAADKRMEILYSAMTSRLSGRQIKQRIAEAAAPTNQGSLFPDIAPSYSIIMHQLSRESMAPIYQLSNVLSGTPDASSNTAGNNLREKVLSEQPLLVRYAQLDQSMERLGRIVKNGSGS